MQMTIRRNPHRTRYVMWLDADRFREVTWPLSASGDADVIDRRGQPRIRLSLPHDVATQESITFSEVDKRDWKLTPRRIVYGNEVWVSTSQFTGQVDAMYRWTEEYLQAYEWLIRNNLTNTDEQVRFANNSVQV
jgi:hypothetical protein